MNWPFAFWDMNGLYGIAAIRMVLLGSLVPRIRFAIEELACDLAKNPSKTIDINRGVEIMVKCIQENMLVQMLRNVILAIKHFYVALGPELNCP